MASGLGILRSIRLSYGDNRRLHTKPPRRRQHLATRPRKPDSPGMNDIPAVPPSDAAQGGTAAAAIHAATLTLDSHIDIPWPTGPDPFSDGARRADLPKMRRGGLRAACFAAYVPQGPLTPEGHAAATSRALAMLDTIAAMGGSAGDVTARICASAAQIESAAGEGVLAVVPAVENGAAIGEDLSLLARFRALGAVYMTLTHNGHNALCDSSNPRGDLGDGETLHGGLSGFGREAIAEMNRLGLLVDVSHVSRDSMRQAVAASRVPVVATHSCVRALCDVPRNLDDSQLDLLRDTGGLVQITAVPSFLRWKARFDQSGVADLGAHIEYAVRRMGVAHVGIGSDFDGGGGVPGYGDASQSGGLTAELVRRGFGADEIALLWGGNFLRLMRQAETA